VAAFHPLAGETRSLSLTSEGKPLISVIMSVYNAERYLADAVNSILAQTYPYFEFIIIDGGSPDGSVAIIRNLAIRDTRIRTVFLPPCNQAHALNVGLKMAYGEWIAYMEADDIALPERFATQMDWIHRTGVDICGSLAKRFGRDDRLFWFPETHEAIRYELLFRCVLLPSTIMMRADIAKAYLFNEQTTFLDYEFWTRLAPHYRMGNVQQVLVKYRRHPQQTTVLKAEQVCNDLCKFRRPYFHNLFPEATAEDYAAFARVAENQPFSVLTELKLAGRWLVRMAQTPDVFLRKRMADRWQASCQRSACLGFDCYRLYRQIAPQFGVVAGQGKLWLACALRLRTGSKSYATLKRLKGAFLRGGNRDHPGGARRQPRRTGNGGRSKPMTPGDETVRAKNGEG